MHAVSVLNDEALIPDLVRGDEAAVSALLERYWEPAYRAALKLTRDPGTAEDAAQEAFVAVLRSAKTFEEGRSFRPWFFRIVVNVASKHVRAGARRRVREAKGAQEDVAASAPGASEAEEADVVREHLGKLSPKLRDVLALRYLEGLSLAEVSQALKCPEGTVS
jgi:RNA polymerase sigma-70 factor (ECF subfamily)